MAAPIYMKISDLERSLADPDFSEKLDVWSRQALAPGSDGRSVNAKLRELIRQVDGLPAASPLYSRRIDLLETFRRQSRRILVELQAEAVWRTRTSATFTATVDAFIEEIAARLTVQLEGAAPSSERLFDEAWKELLKAAPDPETAARHTSAVRESIARILGNTGPGSVTVLLQRACHDGDQAALDQAFGELWSELHERVRRLHSAFPTLSHQLDADDLLSQLWIDIREDTPPKTWARRGAFLSFITGRLKRDLVDRCRRSRREVGLPTDPETGESADFSGLILNYVVRKEDGCFAADLEATLRPLKDPRRNVHFILTLNRLRNDAPLAALAMELRLFHDLAVAEIAELLDIDDSKAQRLIRHALLLWQSHEGGVACDFVPGADWDHWTTWDFHPHFLVPAPWALAVREHLPHILKHRGLEQDLHTPTLWLNAHYSTPGTALPERRGMYAASQPRRDAWTSIRSQFGERGHLILDLIHAPTNDLVWRSYCIRKAGCDDVFVPTADTLQAAFQQYPPGVFPRARR